MKLKIYLLITDWAREFDGQDTNAEVFTNLAAARFKMQNEFSEYLEEYDEDTRVSEIDDMSAEIYEDGYAASKHDKWAIVEKEVDFEDMYIVTRDYVNCYVEDTQQWCSTCGEDGGEAAVFTKAQADALVKSERDKYNLHGSAGPQAIKLINIRKDLVED